MRLILFCLSLILVKSLHGQSNEQQFSAALNDYLKSITKADEPGLAVLVAKPNDHTIYSGGFGIEDIKTRKPITSKSIFNLGSVSKTFVAYGILKLQEEGKLSIEDPILKYFPNFKNKDLVKEIKVKHLLTHTSGLPDTRPVDKDSIFYLTANDAQNWAPILQNEKLNFLPGEQYQYSNPAFNGLALIIEKVSGQKWQDYIDRVIFQKAGMRTSVITDIEYPQVGVGHGYQQINGEWREYDFGEYPTFCAAGNGGVWSSVEELLKYEEAIRKNLIVNKATVDFSRTVYSPPNWKGKNPPFLGYSWFIRNEDGVNMIGHSGDQAGFRAEHWNITGRDIFIAIICNNNHELDGVRKKILALIKEHGL